MVNLVKVKPSLCMRESTAASLTIQRLMYQSHLMKELLFMVPAYLNKTSTLGTSVLLKQEEAIQ